MSCTQFRDEPWASPCIYAERVKIAYARRMEADDRFDDLYAPVIDALDLLLEHVTNEVDDDTWETDAQNALAQLLMAAFRDCDRCDLFLGVGRALRDAGLD